MLRITELRLPLDHAEDALRPAIVQRLRIKDADLLDFKVYKRSHDARKKHADAFKDAVREAVEDALTRPNPTG